jgi:hypothetical protein
MIKALIMLLLQKLSELFSPAGFPRFFGAAARRTVIARPGISSFVPEAGQITEAREDESANRVDPFCVDLKTEIFA